MLNPVAGLQIRVVQGRHRGLGLLPGEREADQWHRAPASQPQLVL